MMVDKVRARENGPNWPKWQALLSVDHKINLPKWLAKIVPN